MLLPFQTFPPAVAKELRLAVSFADFQNDPGKAMKHFQRAVMATGEVGMDPYSDECIGLRVRIAAFLEKYKQYDQSLEDLKALRRDCVRWVHELGDQHFNDGRRTKVLEWAVRTSVHIGEIYANSDVRSPEQAEEALVWAVDTLLREKRRREVEGVKEGEGEWVTDETMGATMECEYTTRLSITLLISIYSARVPLLGERLIQPLSPVILTSRHLMSLRYLSRCYS